MTKTKTNINTTEDFFDMSNINDGIEYGDALDLVSTVSLDELTDELADKEEGYEDYGEVRESDLQGDDLDNFTAGKNYGEDEQPEKESDRDEYEQRILDRLETIEESKMREIGSIRKPAEQGYTTDELQAFLKDISKIPLLTHEQEIELGKRIKDGDIEARNELVNANYRLVISIARKYQKPGIALMDLIMEGACGAMIAAEKYDYTKGLRFSTYATWWIMQSITRAIADQEATVRLPVHVVDNINRLKKAKADLEQELERRPTDEEVAKRLGVSKKEFDKRYSVEMDIVSIEKPVGEDGDSTLGDFISDDSSMKPFDEVLDQMNNERLIEAINMLPDRERIIIKLRYGIDGVEEHTLDEIGKMFGLTRERIRQIEHNILNKLRRNKYVRALMT